MGGGKVEEASERVSASGGGEATWLCGSSRKVLEWSLMRQRLVKKLIWLEAHIK